MPTDPTPTELNAELEKMLAEQARLQDEMKSLNASLEARLAGEGAATPLTDGAALDETPEGLNETEPIADVAASVAEGATPHPAAARQPPRASASQSQAAKRPTSA
jgi:hypothetical protein